MGILSGMASVTRSVVIGGVLLGGIAGCGFWLALRTMKTLKSNASKEDD